MSDQAGRLIRAQDLEPGCMIEIEGEALGTGRSLAKVQAVRDTIQGIEIDIFGRKPINIPSGLAAVNYWTLRVPFDTPVRVSHLPSQLARDTRPAHGSERQHKWDSEPAAA